jgi:uncharacterized membrane protein
LSIYPYILLNLLFSTQAAYAAPIIMMAQNRQSQRDRAQTDPEELSRLLRSTLIVIYFSKVKPS